MDIQKYTDVIRHIEIKAYELKKKHIRPELVVIHEDLFDYIYNSYCCLTVAPHPKKEDMKILGLRIIQTRNIQIDEIIVK